MTLIVDSLIDLRIVELVPSSARSTSSTASPLPSHLVPLLEDVLEQTRAVINKALPVGKKRSALEEAEYEDEGDEGALEREIMMQCEYLHIDRNPSSWGGF